MTNGTQNPPKTYSSAIRDANNYTRWIIDIFRHDIRGRTLEIGFGHDAYYRLLRDLVLVYAAADIDGDAISQARLAHPDVALFHWDVSDSDGVNRIGRGAYDTVLCVNVLEHVGAQDKAITNMIDLLAPGGRLLLFVPAFQSLFTCMDQMAGHHRRYNKGELRSLLAGAGVKIESMYYINPLGGVGWLLNGLFPHGELDSPAINGQIRLFDHYILPLSRLISPFTKSFFGQSLVCVARRACDV